MLVGVQVLVVAVAVLGAWYLTRLWNGSKAPDAARRVGDVLQVAWKAVLALAALGVVAAMVQGCDGRESSPRYQPCTAFHEEECPPAAGTP
jgi:hypothetical protein